MKTRIILILTGVFLCPSFSVLSQHTISGKVTDENGEAVFDAKVKIKDTYAGSRTNVDGKYTIKNLSDGEYVLLVSAAGFSAWEEVIAVKGGDVMKDIALYRSTLMLEEATALVVKAKESTPTTYREITKEEIEAKNYGQDLPYLLQSTPSTVVTSDAGAGVGYTGVRIRGVDPTRTNVTINGIPVNDAESHGTYWVNMPDLASSADNIQVQRGVGTSSNGSAAFGSSINIQLDKFNKEAYAALDNSFGSFQTFKHTIKAGTGLINDKFTMDARVSHIRSAGYIDRASSNLNSVYLSGAWIGKKSNLRATYFTGRERTYQAWWGVPGAKLSGDQDSLTAHFYNNYYPGGMYQTAQDSANLFGSDPRTYNFYTYDNEVDNYRQDYYQLHFNHVFNPRLKVNAAFHYTRGFGYYEQFRIEDDFDTYGFSPLLVDSNMVTTTDLIRRRWLDNHFYGGVYSLTYQKEGLNITFGGGLNRYEGGHFGEVIWARFASESEYEDRFYDNDAVKSELHNYLKISYQYKRLTLFQDLQFRRVDYSFLGLDYDNSGAIVPLTQDVDFSFLNPKGGLSYRLNEVSEVYGSVAVANREPVRIDFTESTSLSRPRHETLMDYEVGYKLSTRNAFLNANAYFMDYKDQLILTGQINDVGAYARVNVPNSYRSGIELDGGYMLTEQIGLAANLTLSQNKIQEFTEYVDEFDAAFNYLGQREIVHENTDLAFTPNIIASGVINYEPINGLMLQWMSKYVGDQYLDNTMNETRKMDAYFISNFRVQYEINNVIFNKITFGLLFNNVFNHMYENNGYTWGYIYDNDRVSENFYYPQAGRNFLAKIALQF